MRTALVLSLALLRAGTSQAAFVVKATIEGHLSPVRYAQQDPAVSIGVEMDGNSSTREALVVVPDLNQYAIAHLEDGTIEPIEGIPPGYDWDGGEYSTFFLPAFYDVDGDGLLDVLLPRRIGHGTIVVGWDGSAVTPDVPDLSSSFNGSQLAVAPNPSRGETDLVFSLDASAGVSAWILDATGRIVRRLLDENRPAGEHRITWDGRDDRGEELPAGVYFSRVRAGAVTVAGRIVLTK